MAQSLSVIASTMASGKPDEIPRAQHIVAHRSDPPGEAWRLTAGIVVLHLASLSRRGYALLIMVGCIQGS